MPPRIHVMQHWVRGFMAHRHMPGVGPAAESWNRAVEAWFLGPEIVNA